MIHDEKYITIGDEIINYKDQYIGIIMKKWCIIYRPNTNTNVKYTINVNIEKTYKAFGNNIGQYDSTRKSFHCDIEPLTAINMYSKVNKVYFNTIFNHMECYNAKIYSEVKLIDNFYIERLIEKFTRERMLTCIGTHPILYNLSNEEEILPVFKMRFYIQKINITTNELICVSQSKSGRKFKVIVPVECVELVKNNNFIKKYLLKRKYINV